MAVLRRIFRVALRTMLVGELMQSIHIIGKVFRETWQHLTTIQRSIWRSCREIDLGHLKRFAWVSYKALSFKTSFASFPKSYSCIGNVLRRHSVL